MTISPVPILRRALNPTEIVSQLSLVEGWSLSGDGHEISIRKTFIFKNFYETMSFVNALAFIAHTKDHHPTLTITYKTCLVRYNTHDVKGLSNFDFECAAGIDALMQ
jgi:4a-hydroxytetrahydrobiopterin dehydratase|tara:strand:- start:41 stop:361 length:321 start_codon:yes stop_codon:yes gene_type:complete